MAVGRMGLPHTSLIPQPHLTHPKQGQGFLSHLTSLGTSPVLPWSGKSGAASSACWERLCLAGAARALLCLLQSLSSLLLLGSWNGLVGRGPTATFPSPLCSDPTCSPKSRCSFSCRAFTGAFSFLWFP